MISYRELASDLTIKVKNALEKRNELVKTYQSIKDELQMVRAENDHLLDMLSEAYPEIADDLSSSSSDECMSHSDNGADGDSSRKNGTVPYSSKKRNGRSARASLHAAAFANTSSSVPVSRRGKRERPSPSLGILDPTPQMIKRRRRQGKRDDRNDPKPIEPLKRDAEGNLIYPIVVGRGQDRIEVHSLGRVICEPDTYHTTRYIWPPGFRSTRVYPSFKANGGRCIYTSEILEGDGEAPVFQVTASDMPNETFRASSASGVWKQILDILTAKGVGVKTHASGPQMYGLSYLGITKVIQELDGATECSRYIMQKWIESGDEDENIASHSDHHDDDTPLPIPSSALIDRELADPEMRRDSGATQNPSLSRSSSVPFARPLSDDDDSAND
ncbi:hypothetical protein EV179_000390 [Coemansia sp. RSA 487]|nr:hypothetical protein LPJ74_002281 [Coemansia sp. RSA 1843]KAJ2093180.1 hypothetical protein IW138_000472 [Coemansia sp. RSA 986]KAJ2217555.1 hypothetical protein EV179_000390 [Coemansia sp. RSA 487]